MSVYLVNKIINLYEKLCSYKSVNSDIFSGFNVNIALIDSGVDGFHPYLFDNIDKKKAFSFINNSNPLMDYLGHGTEVAGVLKQISPWATITPYKIVDTGNASSINVIKAIRKAVDNGADVINLSLGTYKNLEKREDLEIVRIYKEAVLYAFNNNVVIVSSLGNRNLNLDYQLTNKNIVHLPSYFESVISVGSLNKINKLSSFTNYHEFKLFFASLGGDLMIQKNEQLNLDELISTTLSKFTQTSIMSSKKEYSLTAGCSISAAIVTGVIANLILLYKKSSNLHPSIKELKYILRSISYYEYEYFNKHKISYLKINVPRYSKNSLYN